MGNSQEMHPIPVVFPVPLGPTGLLAQTDINGEEQTRPNRQMTPDSEV